jgi:isocitrate dehydrogenase (NAD+)
VTLYLPPQYAIFEPGTRNTGTAIAGKNIANPVAMLNAAVDMLEHLGHHYHANMIHEAVDRTINEDHIHTPGIMFSWWNLSFVNVTFL